MENDVFIRNAAGKICTFRDTKENRNKLTQLSMRWAYILGNRRKWAAQRLSRQRVREESVLALKALGINETELQKIDQSSIVEVSMPHHFDPKVDGRAAMIPWEHLLSSAVKARSAKSELVVVRHLRPIEEDKAKPKSKEKKKKKSKRQKKSDKSKDQKRELEPKKFAFVGATPARFKTIHDYIAEQELVSAGLHPVVATFVPPNPSRRVLCKAIKSAHPDVIHFSGVDAHVGEQALALYEKEEMKFYRSILDGIYLPTGEGFHEKLMPEQFADCLTPGSHRPKLVSINTWYSGARLAPVCVAEGCDAAIGFHNTFDAGAASLFFLRFYQTWLSNQFDLIKSFRAGWRAIAPYKKKIKGSGITLWQRNTVFQPDFVDEIEDSKGYTQVLITQGSKHSTVVADPEQDDIRDLVGVRIVPEKSLNVSLLQNQRSILREMTFWYRFPKTKRGVNLVREVEVNVRLDIGDESFPYRSMVTLGTDYPQIDLADGSLKADRENPEGGIRVPLTSTLLQAMNERVLSGIFIEIKWHDQILYRHTHSVELAPIDEWKLDVVNNGWLPSFVRPRDPAIIKIIDAGAKYLKAIEDNTSASFQGYQADDVEPQVKAIWWAILNEFHLNYVSPPPAYRAYTQRLRSPSQILRERNGTCVDLTILLASCLEWIELLPVIVTTNIHAFSGYWVSEDAHKRFLDFAKMPSIEDNTHDRREVAETFPWSIGFGSYESVKGFISDLDLKPLEATALTRNESFSTAHADARNYFRDTSDCSIDPTRSTPGYYGSFEALIDISSSRKYVTPLPMFGKTVAE